MVDISIIIVNWNTRDLLAQCLQSLASHADSWQPEVFVVDNASEDDSVALVKKQFPWVKLIANNQNVGFARANNQAIHCASGRYILLLNSDTIVLPGALSKLVAFADKHEDIGVLGPALLDATGSLQPSWAKFPTILSELRGIHYREKKAYHSAHIAKNQTAYQVDWLAGACLLVRQEVIAQVGVLDDLFFLYSEETDWCLRIKSAGWHIVYLPEAQIIHLEGGSSERDLPRTSYLLYHSKLLYAHKHFGLRQAIALKIGFVLLLLIKTGVKLLGGQLDAAKSRWKLAGHLLKANLST